MGSSDVHALGVILYLDSVTTSSIMQLSRIYHFYSDRAKIAWIFHEPEPNIISGHECKRHLHLLLVVPGNISRDKFMRDFDISGHCCEEINDYRQFIRYLVHRTPDSATKIQYPISDIHANFDISSIFASTLDNTKSEAQLCLDITEWAVKNNASVYQIMRYVASMGYPWQKFRQNFSIIYKAVDEEKLSFNPLISVVSKNGDI